MKIRVIKSASNKRPQGFCITYVDEPPMAKK